MVNLINYSVKPSASPSKGGTNDVFIIYRVISIGLNLIPEVKVTCYITIHKIILST